MNKAKKEPALKTCPICGKRFQGGRGNHLYCGLACKRIALNKKKRVWEYKNRIAKGNLQEWRHCVMCGKKFSPAISALTRFCSDECEKQYQLNRRDGNAH